MLAHARQQFAQFDVVLVTALGAFVRALHAFLHRIQIGQRQFGIDGLDVRQRIDAAGDMHDVLVLEAAHHVGDVIHLADVGEKFIPQSFALGRAGHEAGDVHEFDRGREDFFGFGDLRELLQARVRHLDDTDVRVDRAEGIILRGDARLGERVEERGLAHVRQADDAAFETHNMTSFSNSPSPA